MANETQPYVKEHNGKQICFADTLTQAKNALEGSKEVGEMEEAHLMLFGVEEWKSSDMKSLHHALKNHNHNRFNRLEIFGCEMTAQHQLEFADILEPEYLSSITQFDIDNTTLEPEGAKAIFSKVGRVGNIKHLNLQGSVNGKAQVMKNIADECVEKHDIYKMLDHIDLKINELNEECGEHVATLISGCKINGTHLDLFYNDLKAQGATHIAKAMSLPDVSITHLDLSCNNIGDEGAQAIALMLQQNNTLEVLKLALNNISFIGATPIFDALGQEKPGESINRTLRTLDISANVMKANATVGELEVHPRQAEYDDLAAQLDSIEAKIDEAVDNGDDYAELSAKETELTAKFNEVADIIANSTKDQYPELTSLQNMIKHCHLNMFDFTGVEFGTSQWNKFANFLSYTKPTNNFKEPWTLRFSIVDLMNESNLKIMEDQIWGGTKKDKFKHIDWRRRDDAKDNEKKE